MASAPRDPYRRTGHTPPAPLPGGGLREDLSLIITDGTRFYVPVFDLDPTTGRAEFLAIALYEPTDPDGRAALAETVAKARRDGTDIVPVPVPLRAPGPGPGPGAVPQPRTGA
ncbi:hypothetical protein [Amycolatopsis sp. DSM 110486]|uniref:hypothetical protein n=1 Tax=Amycolatopsis sp. DSM 110486 TaxID=2865832 RepID=UPI001C69F215|nr:hypothetical protein [Amycolatopsis sp. DSM 110486]QYN16842.1 hypothetical protein K1T34_28770 [Amycolatopsis sp. DSM 110486]